VKMNAHRDVWTVITGGLLASVLVIAVAQPAASQDRDYDARWLPWLGCWEASVGPAEGDDAPMLCLRSVPDGEGVEMLTVEGGEIVAQETIRADGVTRPASHEGCDGSERVAFSDDGDRVYMRADLVCEGGLERTSAGIMSMVSPYEWLDVRTVTVRGESVPWVLRYQLATLEAVEAAGLEGIAADRVMAQQAARIAASAALTIEDVIDASTQMDTKGVQAWVVERGDQFTLDASRLVSMADAGVPESVIDMVVAVSYPDHFVVDRGLEGGAEAAESDYARTGAYGPAGRAGYGYGRYYDPFFLSPFYSPYAGYGYYSPYRFGYGYGIGYGGYGFGYGGFGYGFGYGGYGYYPTIVVVGTRQHQPQGTSARAVRGRGYTQGGRSSSSGSSGARPQGSSSSGASAAPSRSGSSSSGSRASGRKAKPRGRRNF